MPLPNQTEYTTEDIGDPNPQVFTKLLNHRATQGWKVHSFSQTITDQGVLGYRILFERQKRTLRSMGDSNDAGM